MPQLGNTSADSGSSSSYGALHTSGPFEATENGLATYIEFYDGAGRSPQVGRCAIHSEDLGNPGYPGALVAVSDEFTFPASPGNAGAPITANLVAGTKYYLGFCNPDVGISFWWNSTLTGTVKVFGGMTYPTFSNPVVAGDLLNNYGGLMTVFVTYTPTVVELEAKLGEPVVGSSLF